MTLRKVIMANGVFDILHIGHVLYLEAAAKMGDKLVVAVTRDAFVNKGAGRPVNPQDHRAAVVGAIWCVDDVLLCDGPIDALEAVKPAIFVKGKDYYGKIEQMHGDYCAAHNIQIKFTDTPIFSATKIINDRIRQG